MEISVIGEKAIAEFARRGDRFCDAASVPFTRERKYSPEYTEAIAQIKEQHKLELERLSQELRIGLQAEVSARAEEQVIEQIQSLQNLYKQQKEQNIQLQQRLDEMESLRQLETENQQLRQRIQDLENAVEQRPSQEWVNTMSQQATKALNKQVKQALEKTIDLRSLAQEPPKENAQECLRLMGMALKNLASAMNNTQALEAAAIILGSEPTPTAIAYRAEQLEMLPQAVTDIRQVLAKPGCTWQDYWAVAQEYEVIKADYWAELTTEETELIAAASKPQSPYKRIQRCISDTLTRIPREEETAHAPLGGASPQTVQGVSELEEELPAVTDCTSLTLVDFAQGESASLLAENQDCGVEPRECQYRLDAHHFRNSRQSISRRNSVPIRGCQLWLVSCSSILCCYSCNFKARRYLRTHGDMGERCS
ncbi:hypothetical protein [Nostoc sp.]|uniref:hypothetical protein n=1 Tax=Nostoc sp. TaxID=1180 RepID=UPI002FF8C8F5